MGKQESYISRLYQEHSELKLKIKNLRKFIISDKIDSLPEIDRRDLKLQLKHMEEYFKVLNRRVSRTCNNA